jgi:nucleotide-binding universal stress UspA family protein
MGGWHGTPSAIPLIDALPTLHQSPDTIVATGQPVKAARHILVATDGSETAFKAAKFAGDLARALGATVSIAIVHDEQGVIPDAWNLVGLQTSDGKPLASTEAVRQRVEDHALTTELAKTAEAAGELKNAPKLLNLWGHAADRLCEYAQQHAVDLIVIGSHGRSGIKRAILGSVSHAVANAAPCAVTIVK